MPKAGGPVPVVVMGLGFIGQEIARAAYGSPEVQLVGAVDTNPQLVGRKLGDVVGVPALSVKISETLEAVAEKNRGVLLHATGSRLPQVADQLLLAIRGGFAVVSTCEELAFPYLKHPELGEKLDKAAQKAGVAVLGTGVNPGFVMDRLVATAGAAAGEVRHVTVTRVVDARTRRPALLRKIGVGLTEEEFDQLFERDQIGHVGLLESTALAALGLGIDCDDFEEEVSSVVAEEDIEGAAFSVKKGRVAGIQQIGIGLAEGQEKVRLELTLAVGAESPGDVIIIEADPPIRMEIPGGVAGDTATAHCVVNAAARVAAAEPGLLTVLELPAGR